MGMDVLDIVFRLEKAFGIKVGPGDLERHIPPRTPPDFLVADLLSLVRAKWPAYTVKEGVLACDVNCVTCGYNLRGLAPFANCPECGAAVAYERQIRTGVERALVDALGVDPARIHDDASISRDLGAS